MRITYNKNRANQFTGGKSLRRGMMFEVLRQGDLVDNP